MVTMYDVKRVIIESVDIGQADVAVKFGKCGENFFALATHMLSDVYDSFKNTHFCHSLLLIG